MKFKEIPIPFGYYPLDPTHVILTNHDDDNDDIVFEEFFNKIKTFEKDVGVKVNINIYDWNNSNTIRCLVIKPGQYCEFYMTFMRSDNQIIITANRSEGCPFLFKSVIDKVLFDKDTPIHSFKPLPYPSSEEDQCEEDKCKKDQCKCINDSLNYCLTQNYRRDSIHSLLELAIEEGIEIDASNLEKLLKSKDPVIQNSIDRLLMIR